MSASATAFRMNSRDEWETLAADAEAKVLALASQVRAPGAALRAEFAQWQAAVRALIDAGAYDSQQVKSFAAKIAQAALVQENMGKAATFTGAAYRAAARATMHRVCYVEDPVAFERLVDDNPLVLVPPLVLLGQAAPNVVVVFCPGVARTGTEFGEQFTALRELGVHAKRAETGSFVDPDKNAEAIAEAIREVRRTVSADARILLTGYSQGITNILAFIRDRHGRFADDRRGVAGIHVLHGAAGGSQIGDLVFALGNFLTSDEPISAEAHVLLDAFHRAQAEVMGLPASAARGFALSLSSLRILIREIVRAVRALEGMAAPALRRIGLAELSDLEMSRRVLGLMIKGASWTQTLSQSGGKVAQSVGRTLDPLWRRAVSPETRDVLSEGMLSWMFEAYINGGLRSLTTSYASELLGDARLRENLARIPILNSIGAIPPAREKSLVPRSQRVGYAFFRQLGLASDYQVAVQNQSLERVLPTAIDLPTEAIGHWGVAGIVVPVDHPTSYFCDFSPSHLTRAALTAWTALGVV